MTYARFVKLQNLYAKVEQLFWDQFGTRKSFVRIATAEIARGQKRDASSVCDDVDCAGYTGYTGFRGMDVGEARQRRTDSVHVRSEIILKQPIES
jgi:hypothetical protein